jgi:hypothetical protein
MEMQARRVFAYGTERKRRRNITRNTPNEYGSADFLLEHTVNGSAMSGKHVRTSPI